MIAPARVALLKDAYYQVMDNWVFRILAVICMVFILIPFVVGLREEGVVIAFGLYEWDYAEIFNRLGGAGQSSAQSGDLRKQAIDFYMTYVVQMAAGNMGVLFSIAATAFFVPQMLEKGAADVLFHKPLGRLSFYLSRYFAGVLFVVLLSSVLALGNYLGFLVASGHNDPGILMGAPLMTYVFAVIYSVAMFIGVFTRSTVASILLTVIFFFLNGCVDTAWKGGTEFELQLTRSGAAAAMNSSRSGDSEDDKEDKGVEALEEDRPILDMLWNTLCAIHYVLPKTGDADVIAKKLRSAINAPPFREEGSRLALHHLPEGLRMGDPSEGRAPREFSSEEQEALGEVRFALLSEEESPALRYTLFRREAVKVEKERRGRVRTSTENGSAASKALQDLITARLGRAAVADPEATERVERENVRFGGQGLQAVVGYRLDWNTLEGQGRQAVIFRVGEDWIYTLLVEDESFEQSEERHQELLDRVGKELGYDASVGAYEEAFRLDAPWRYNILFSVGSTLAFVLLMLGLGYWKLRRIDF